MNQGTNTTCISGAAPDVQPADFDVRKGLDNLSGQLTDTSLLPGQAARSSISLLLV